MEEVSRVRPPAGAITSHMAGLWPRSDSHTHRSSVDEACPRRHAVRRIPPRLAVQTHQEVVGEHLPSDRHCQDEDRQQGQRPWLHGWPNTTDYRRSDVMHRLQDGGVRRRANATADYQPPCASPDRPSKQTMPRLILNVYKDDC